MKKIVEQVCSFYDGHRKKLLMMRNAVLIILISAFQVLATGSYSQTAQLSLKLKDATIKEVLTEIENQSEFYFLYNSELIDVTRKVDISVNKEKVNDVLSRLFSDDEVNISISDRHIVLTPVSEKSVQQQKSVSGKVTDSSGEPLPGVTVLIKGTTNGTVTNVNGNYTLANIPENVTLVFSFVGMRTQEIELGNQSTIDIIMEVDAIGLDEVIAVGYGVQKKSDIINSVVSVDAQRLIKSPTTDIGDMLRGKAAGVFVTSADASPGSSSNILIRGKNSINGGNSPLVIADGVPVFNINDVNPNDIASMEILKDAAAQAIYGARASNGVILITTKRAKAGETKVDYRGYYGSQTIGKNFDVYNGEEFAQLRREATRTANNGEYLPDNEIFTPIELDVLNSEEYIDWFDEVLRIGSIQNHNIGISSGTDKNRVYTSFDYLNHQGVIPGTDYNKLGVRLNIDQKLFDWLTLGANTSWHISKNNDPGTGNTLKWLVTASPLGKIYNEDGSLNLTPSGVQESINPLLDLQAVTNEKKDQNNMINVYFDLKPIKNFNYRLNTSYVSWGRERTSYATSESFQGVRWMDGQGSGEIEYVRSKEWQVENIITYNIEKAKQSIGFTIIQSASEKQYNSFINEASYFSNDILGIYGLSNAEINVPRWNDVYKRKLLSFAGRIQYDFDNKYYLNASIRADGSTVFGANNKWGYFPAVSVGWNIYKEDYIESISVISNLKLRASYGSVGNEAIGPYQSQSVAAQRNYLLNDKKLTGYMPGSTLPNPDLRWETSKTLNTALDFGLWKNRLSGTLEIYKTNTTDLLIDRALNAALGYTKMKSNIGEVQNKGIELSLNGVIADKKDLTINAGLSFSKNKNEIVHLYGEVDEEGNEVDDIGNLWFIGKPIDVYYQYKAIGIFQAGDDIANSHQPVAEPGDLKLYDRYPDDGVLNADDRVITKKDPDWYGSFNLDMRYKNFDFSADILTVQGILKNNEYLYSYGSGGSLRSILNGIKQDYWTPENPTGNWPRPNESVDPDNNGAQGLQDASYIRLQTIELGYSLPTQKIWSKGKLDRLRVYCTGQNLITLTDFQSYSPEKEPNAYPEAISVVFGLQVTF